jgi:hypothetical protein
MENTTMTVKRTTLDDWIDDKRVDEVCDGRTLAEAREVGAAWQRYAYGDGDEPAAQVEREVQSFGSVYIADNGARVRELRVDLTFGPEDASDVTIVKILRDGSETQALMLDGEKSLDACITALLTARSILKRLNDASESGAEAAEVEPAI